MNTGDQSIVSRLSDWEAVDAPLAPLTSDQLDSVLDLAAAAQERPFPSHLRRCERLADCSSTASVLSDSGSTAAENGLFPAFHKLEGGGTKIDNGQRFLQWFHQVERSLSSQQDQPYRRYISELEQQAAITGGLQTQVNESLDQLSELTLQYEMVSTKTTSLHTACQHLLQEQTKLAEVSVQVQERLQVFQEADKVAQKLTSPTLSVHSETFLPLLARIDESITYLKKHPAPNYLECSVYLVKFRACLSRALEMIRSHVKNTIETATTAASVPTPASTSSPHTAFTLFYGKFRAAAPRVRHLIQEVERRAGHSPEYDSLLGDLEQLYLSCRLQLLQPSVQSAVGQLLTVHHRDHCGLVRAGCAFLLHVCEDEQQLYCQFFTPAPPPTTSLDLIFLFLERLCMVLYDNLRPQIIHVQHLETLAELTAILRNEVLGHHCAAHPQLTAFERITRQMLQDVQERLVYRTTVYIRTDIVGYQAAPGDLAYPEKLEMMETIAEQLAAAEDKKRTHSRQNSSSSVVSVTSLEVGNITARAYSGNSPADLHGMWYPPVRRTLVCLSKLYRCLEKPIFQGLSQEVLSGCLQAVSQAADAISSNSKKAKSDGQLFEIKHLLILREQIVPFQVDFQVRETALDFTKIKTAALSLLSRKGEILSLSSNNALLEFLLEGTPGVQEMLRDGKKEVDRRLKLTCEQFILDTTSAMVGPVLNFNAKVDHFNVLKQDRDKNVSLSEQLWAHPDQVRSVIAEAQRLIKSSVPQTQRKMQLYLANRETEFILFRPIRSAVLSAFVNLLTILRAEYSLDQQTICGCPSQEQLAALLTSVMIKPRARESRYSVDRQLSEDRDIREEQSEPCTESHDEVTTNGVKDEESDERVKEVEVSG